MISYLQHKLANGRLYRTSFDDGGFVIWKPLTWGRYKRYREASLSAGHVIATELEESVFRECVLFSSYDSTPPSKIANEQAYYKWQMDMMDLQPFGVIETVAGVIIKLSGTGRPERTQEHINLARGETGLMDQIAAIICKTFPAYKLEDIETMDWPTVCKRLIQVELVTGVPMNLDLVDQAKEELQWQKARINKLIDQVNSGAAVSDEEDQRSTEMQDAQREAFREAQRAEVARRMRR